MLSAYVVIIMLNYLSCYWIKELSNVSHANERSDILIVKLFIYNSVEVAGIGQKLCCCIFQIMDWLLAMRKAKYVENCLSINQITTGRPLVILWMNINKHLLYYWDAHSTYSAFYRNWLIHDNNSAPTVKLANTFCILFPDIAWEIIHTSFLAQSHTRWLPRNLVNWISYEPLSFISFKKDVVVLAIPHDLNNFVKKTKKLTAATLF